MPQKQNPPPVTLQEIKRQIRHRDALPLLTHIDLDPMTLGTVLGLLEGLASDDRELHIKRRGDETMLDLTKEGELEGIRFRGESLTACLAAAAAGPAADTAYAAPDAAPAPEGAEPSPTELDLDDPDEASYAADNHDPGAEDDDATDAGTGGEDEPD